MKTIYKVDFYSHHRFTMGNSESGQNSAAGEYVGKKQ